MHGYLSDPATLDDVLADGADRAQRAGPRHARAPLRPQRSAAASVARPGRRVRLPERSGDQVRIGVAITVPEPYGIGAAGRARPVRGPVGGVHPAAHHAAGPDRHRARRDRSRSTSTWRPSRSSTRRSSCTLRGTATFRPVSPVVFVQVAEGVAGCEALEGSVRSGVLAQELRFRLPPARHGRARGARRPARRSVRRPGRLRRLVRRRQLPQLRARRRRRVAARAGLHA